MPILFGLSLASCGDSAPGPGVLTSAQELATTVGGKSLVRACGDTAQTTPSLVVTATSKHCFSCNNLGWYLRRFQESPRSHAAVLTVQEDTAVVCGFMGRERISLPVLTLQTPPRPSAFDLRYPIAVRMLGDSLLDAELIQGAPDRALVQRFTSQGEGPSPSNPQHP